MESHVKCKFCGEMVAPKHLVTMDAFKIHCFRCGYYRITGTALETLLSLSLDDLLLFSGYLRNNSSEDNPILLTSESLIDIQATIAQLKRLTVLDRINLVIRYLGDQTKYLGELIQIDDNIEYTRFYCKNSDEFDHINSYMIDAGIISEEVPIGAWSLTVAGLQKYASLKEINIESKKVFIAMSFDPSLEPIKKAIKAACDECDFVAIRVDSKEHVEKVCDKIIGDIKESRFVVADFTQNKQGVYFEAGFALGLGLKVIWTCKDNEKEKLHFDTRQYNHIFWRDPEDLKEQLVQKIRAVIK